MDDGLGLFDGLARRPDLPVPSRSRWQPLRLGLVELFLYDSEEFWFRDGHLLLRGNNGTGKSKVLSLTLPFLLDAQLRASRIEPDGDPGKKMAWNLLMNGYERRNGYSWIEFGRLAEDGTPRYLTLGAGLSAVSARSEVDGWFFILEDPPGGARIGQDLWLINENRIVPTRERLRELLDGRGQVFDTAMAYRRAVDERLFRLGTKRYEALMDTLIQLRQPQLSRKPDEAALSDALTEALPPMPVELLGDVAEAMNQLDEDRRRLEEFQQLGQAVDRFDQRYRVYAGALSRRQARELRHSQTDFDNASRDCNEADTRFEQARAAEAAAGDAHEQATLALARQRSALDTLQSDPTMQDANRLATAQAELQARREAVRRTLAARGEVAGRLEREEASELQSAARATRAEQGIVAARAQCLEQARSAGVMGGYGGHPLAVLAPVELAGMAAGDIDRAQAALREMIALRREQLALLHRRRASLDQAVLLAGQRQEAVRERQDDRAAAAARRGAADSLVDSEGRRLSEAWSTHLTGLRQLRCDPEAPLAALADWVVGLEGDNPARQALLAAQQDCSARLAAARVDLDGQAQILGQERAALQAEQADLAAGKDSAPPLPHARGPATRQDRPGAPLWQLIDFHDHLDAAARAGLEAALEASGLLDAWVTPDGSLIPAEGGRPWLDSQIVSRAALPAASLGDSLRATVPAQSAVTAATVERLLAGLACGEVDRLEAEAWISPEGRYRLGALAGAWGKPQAVYIGFAARAAARARRQAEIVARLGELAELQALLHRQLSEHGQACRQAEQEWRDAPADDALRQAHAAAGSAAREFREAGERLVLAQAAAQEAEQVAQAAAQRLERDALDLGLPTDPAALQTIEASLILFNDTQHHLAQAIHEWRRAWPELEQQRGRVAEARQALLGRDGELAEARIEAEQAEARYDVLRQAVGLQVDALRRQLAEAREAVAVAEAAVTRAERLWRTAGEARAVAATTREVAGQTLVQRGEARTQAVVRLQRFAETTLLSSALPGLDLPESGAPWTIDPALTLARRVEQALTHVKDDDDTYARLQRQIGEDLQELQRALSALGHQAPAEPSDWGLVVHIIYQNRPERPDRLAARMADEIAQRSELLTARERLVLENHLQAEIAAEVQRLLQAAERQVVDINAELHKRPTSTGLRYRLQWQPLTEGEGAPVGLEAARHKLLNTSADLWTAEDRRVVGAMLQQRIAAERDRVDSGQGRGEGGALIDLLARALDYRHWHRFRVQRFQDGQWRKLSGPASSGERALGLTVPLFAAIASFYSKGGDANAPRLMLLDEAFAGIDDTARAHCMGLIREFDLDFVITSEREWGCYAELPGVAICQLQRREGIDAVFVSRWTWDGRAKRQQADPDRRFAGR